MNQDLRAQFDPKYLRCLVPFMAQTDIRYYLCGLSIEKAERGGVYLVACDGHTLAVVHDKDGSIEGEQRALIRVCPALIAASRVAGSKKHNRMKHRVLVSGQRVFIAPEQGSFGGTSEMYIQPGHALIEGKYPDWRALLPDFRKLNRGGGLGSGAINASYLARLDRVCDPGRSGDKGVTLWQEDGNKAVFAQIQGVPELLVVLMPMRGNSDEQQRELFKPFPFALATPAKAQEPAPVEAAVEA